MHRQFRAGGPLCVVLWQRTQGITHRVDPQNAQHQGCALMQT